MRFLGRKRLAHPLPLWASDKGRQKPARAKTVSDLGEPLFFIAFLAFCLKYTLDYSSLFPSYGLFRTLNTMLVGISITASMLKIMTQKYTSPLRFALIMAVCALIGYSSLISINFLFLLGFLPLMGMQDIDLKKIVKVSFWAKVVSIAAHVAWYIYVYNTNPEAISFVFRVGGAPRHYFFMGHANTFSAILVWASLEYIFLNYDRLKFHHMGLVWAVNYIFFVFTDTITIWILLSVVTFLIALDKFGKGIFDRALTFLAKYVYVFCSVFFPGLAIIYMRLDGRLRETWHALDYLFTGRLWFGAYAHYAHGPTFLGRQDFPPQNVFWEGRWFDTMTVFDNYYLGNFYSYGIINLIFTAAAFIVLSGKMENAEKIMLTGFSVFAIMESSATNLYICFVLFIIGKYIYLERQS